LPLLVENPRLLNNHHTIGSHEVKHSAPNLGGGNINGAPGGILEIAHNIAAPVGGLFGDHLNDLHVMVEMVRNLPCQMANLAWQRTKKYSLLRKR
jgi:hypothetical protein